jgi:hypothetical protein
VEYALLELSIHNIRKDLELAVRVGSESGPGLDPVLIKHAQMPEAHVVLISISIATMKNPLSVLGALAVCRKEPMRPCGG